jgi:hypothetical protein
MVLIEEKGECKIFGDLGVIVQVALALLSFGALICIELLSCIYSKTIL